jgi:hypothetical protein
MKGPRRLWSARLWRAAPCVEYRTDGQGPAVLLFAALPPSGDRFWARLFELAPEVRDLLPMRPIGGLVAVRAVQDRPAGG